VTEFDVPRWLWISPIVLVVGAFAGLALLVISDDLLEVHWYWPRYAENYPLSAAMMEAARSQGGGYRARGTEEQKQRLFESVPLGTAADEAIAIMASEGFDCGHGRDTEGEPVVACGHTRAPDRMPHWYVELELDEGGQVTDAKATLLK
jgi:hypothetical protein